MRIYHYTVQAFKENIERPDGGFLMNDITEVTINHALDEEDALKQARKLIKRAHYRISKIWECHQCADSKVDKELHMETLKFLKNHNTEEE